MGMQASSLSSLSLVPPSPVGMFLSFVLWVIDSVSQSSLWLGGNLLMCMGFSACLFPP